MIFLYNPTLVVPHLHIIKEYIYIALIDDVNKAVAIIFATGSKDTDLGDPNVSFYFKELLTSSLYQPRKPEVVTS